MVSIHTTNPNYPFLKIVSGTPILHTAYCTLYNTVLTSHCTLHCILYSTFSMSYFIISSSWCADIAFLCVKKSAFCPRLSRHQIEISPEFGRFMGYFQSCHCSVVRFLKKKNGSSLGPFLGNLIFLGTFIFLKEILCYFWELFRPFRSNLELFWVFLNKFKKST